MKTIIMGIFRVVFGGIGKCISTVSGWCFSTVQKVGVSVGYIAFFMLLGAGAAGVLTTDLPLKLLSLGLTLIVARIVGIFCLLLAGFVLAHVVNADARIQAEKIAKDKEEFNRKLKETNDQLNGVKKDLENKIDTIAKLEKEIAEKNEQIFKAQRTINIASVKDVLKLFLIEAEMTIYDFDNDPDMDNRELKVEGLVSFGHHRLRSLWQYIGFREEKIKVNFGVNLNDLHLEMVNSTGEGVLYVYGVRPTHSFEDYTQLHNFSMLRKVYLQECQMNRDDKEYKRRRADKEVIETKDGKMWEIVSATHQNEEYTRSKDNPEMIKGISRQEDRIRNVLKGLNTKPYKALDDEVIKRAEEFLKVLLRPICKTVKVIIKDERPDDWSRVEALPGLQKFCEDYNTKQLQCLNMKH